MNHAKTMYNYHIWANGVLLERLKELPADVLHTQVQSSYSTIAETFSHIYVVDLMWLRVLQGMDMQEALSASMSLLEETNVYSIAQFSASFQELAQSYNEWMANETDFEQRILLENPWSGARKTSYSEILFHTANHGTYHRGNITAMLRQQGHASAMNDLCLYWYQKESVAK